MTTRKRPPKPRESTLALGKICGCGKCRYCRAWQGEQTILAMVDEVRRGKEIAQAYREKELNKWRDQDE